MSTESQTTDRHDTLAAEYVRLLECWYPAAKAWTHQVRNEPGLTFYGTGGHENWAVQAQCTAFAALAVLSTAPELDEARIGCGREVLRLQALQMLRYILRTHKSGTLLCTNGESWGYSWISSLGFERCSHGIAALRPWLEEEDLAGIRALMISESDFLLDGYPVVGAVDYSTGRNKPESNIWNGSMLYRTAMLFPDAPHASKYRDTASALLLNGISIPADALADTPYNGKPLREWHIGPNFTEQFGLNHHGYMNVGYMVICLSNIAMLHYFCRDYNIIAPPELYHHAAELWRLVKSLTFADGRLWRIGGDARVRYCYCQDYAVPMWVLADDLWQDEEALQFAANWLMLVAGEQSSNHDGSFLGGRLSSLAQVSPLYYCRLDGDRAASLSMGAYWLHRRHPGNNPAVDLTAMTVWHDDFHGTAMVRGKRLASWAWKAAERPCGTVVPADRSDMVEWQWNLAGRVRGAGCMVSAEAVRSQVDCFTGGFISTGLYHWVTTHNPAEGTGDERAASARIVFAVLPDDATVVVLQQARTLSPVYLTEVAGLFLNMPNDVYNGGVRSYRISGEDRVFTGAGGEHLPSAETIDCGNTLGIDGRITVHAIYGGSLSLRRPGVRRVNLRYNVPLWHSGDGANLYCDLICLPYTEGLTFYDEDTLLYDIGVAVTIDGTSPVTCLPARVGGAVKVMEITGADGYLYLLAANMGEDMVRVNLPLPVGAEVLHGTPSIGMDAELDTGAALLLRLPGYAHRLRSQ